MDKKKTYKQIHGTTRIGDFLRSIGKSNLIGKVIDAGGDIAKGDVLGAIKTLLLEGDNGMTPEERSHAVEMVKLDIERERSISTRWNSDLKYGNILTKSIRPSVLIVLTVSYIVGWYLGYPLDDISNVLTIVLTAYFGGRSMEKTFGK
tara:strand:+ start:224 stop:667 length:444 start_codon:yes stop_codon:yes gene_type:complete